jgi:hypothetical protein
MAHGECRIEFGAAGWNYSASGRVKGMMVPRLDAQRRSCVIRRKT